MGGARTPIVMAGNAPARRYLRRASEAPMGRQQMQDAGDERMAIDGWASARLSRRARRERRERQRGGQLPTHFFLAPARPLLSAASRGSACGRRANASTPLGPFLRSSSQAKAGPHASFWLDGGGGGAMEGWRDGNGFGDTSSPVARPGGCGAPAIDASVRAWDVGERDSRHSCAP